MFLKQKEHREIQKLRVMARQDMITLFSSTSIVQRWKHGKSNLIISAGKKMSLAGNPILVYHLLEAPTISHWAALLSLRSRTTCTVRSGLWAGKSKAVKCASRRPFMGLTSVS